MRKRVASLSGILLLFSFTVTAVLIGAFLLYIKYTPAPNLDLPSYLADLNNESVIISIEQGTRKLPLNIINRFITKNQIENLYLNEMISNLPYLLIFILVFFIICAVMLSKILHNQQDKQMHLLAKQLSLIDDNRADISGHPAIQKAYSDIKDRLHANALDFMRLSSYVTHEQKNMLSLLRAKLQLSDNDELVRDLDKVVDSLNDINRIRIHYIGIWQAKR